jgi:hypothetical protein
MRSLILLIAAMGAAVIGSDPLLAQAIASRPGSDAFAATQTGDWTVVTMAPDGSWGVAASTTFGEALAGAISDCKAVSSGQIGCGAQTRAVRSGWIVALRCGDSNIVAAERELADAERAALNREAELRNLHSRNLPPCMWVLTVGPHGAVQRTAWRPDRSSLRD